MGIDDQSAKRRSQFWAALAQRRRDRDADISGLGLDAIPSPTSTLFSADHLAVLLADCGDDANARDRVFGDVFRAEPATDLMVTALQECSHSMFVTLLERESKNWSFPAPVVAAMVDRALDGPPSVRRLALTQALRAEFDAPQLLSKILASDWAGFRWEKAGDPHPLSDGSSESPVSPAALIEHMPASAARLARWVHDEISDVYPKIAALSPLTVSVAHLVTPLLSLESAQLLSKLSGDVLTPNLGLRLVERSDLDRVVRARVLAKMLAASEKLRLSGTVGEASFSRYLALTGLCDPAPGPPSAKPGFSTPRYPLAYPSAQFVAAAALELGDHHPLLVVLDAARGILSDQPPNLSLDTATWLASSPHLDPDAFCDWLHEMDDPPQLGTAPSKKLRERGVPLDSLLDLMSFDAALSQDPSEEWSPLLLAHALASWETLRSRLQSFARPVSAHLEAGGVAAVKALLDSSFDGLARICSSDDQMRGVVLDVVDRALSHVPAADLQKVHGLSRDWDGSLYELLCVLGLDPDLSAWQ